MARRSRLDAELVRRGLARSREHAVALIAEGRVAVAGRAATKPATGVEAGTPVVVRTDPDAAQLGLPRRAQAARRARRVPGRRSRAAARSTPAPPPAASPRCCSAAAPPRSSPSTSATASWPGRCAPTTGSAVHERTNVRTLTPEAIDGPVDLVVADLSFISLRLVLPGAHRLRARRTPTCCRWSSRSSRSAASGSAPAAWSATPSTACRPCWRSRRPRRPLGWGTAGVVASPLPGPAGNVEFFLWLRRDAGPPQEDQVRRAVEEGPQ